MSYLLLVPIKWSSPQKTFCSWYLPLPLVPFRHFLLPILSNLQIIFYTLSSKILHHLPLLFLVLATSEAAKVISVYSIKSQFYSAPLEYSYSYIIIIQRLIGYKYLVYCITNQISTIPRLICIYHIIHKGRNFKSQSVCYVVNSKWFYLVEICEFIKLKINDPILQINKNSVPLVFTIY